MYRYASCGRRDVPRRGFRLFVALAVTGALLASGGCESRPSDEEIGVPIFKLPDLPGSKEPYPLPRLDVNEPADEASPAEPPVASKSDASAEPPANSLPSSQPAATRQP